MNYNKSSNLSRYRCYDIANKIYAIIEVLAINPNHLKVRFCRKFNDWLEFDDVSIDENFIRVGYFSKPSDYDIFFRYNKS